MNVRFLTLALFALPSTVLAQAPCVLLADLNPGTNSSVPQKLTRMFGNSLLFTAEVPSTGAETYIWSPTQSVQLLTETRPGTLSGNPDRFTECDLPQGRRIFFAAAGTKMGGTTGEELWITDGTAAGTNQVKEIAPGTRSAVLSEFTPFHQRLVFTANDSLTGQELWTSDGTAAGTMRLTDINPGRASSYPTALVALADCIVFSAFSSATGSELWVTDGTSTSLLKEFTPGPTSSNIAFMTRHGDHAYFVTAATASGTELWKTDGTTTGTVLVKDIVPGQGSSVPGYLASRNGLLYFTASQPGLAQQTWVSDGTASGTQSLGAAAGRQPRGFTAASGKVFYSAFDSFSGTELYVTDGTPSGSRLVKDLEPGRLSSGPIGFCAAGDGVCFTAKTANGNEPWFSDGTAAGTYELCDLNPGTDSSDPREFVVAGGSILFSARTSATGWEIFRIAHPGATVETLFGSSHPSHPELRTQGGVRPVLGRSITFEATGPANHAGFLILGPSRLLPLPPLSGLTLGGTDWVGALLPGSVIVASTTGPSLQLTATIPNTANLDGNVANIQAFWVNPNGPPLLQVSNGMHLRLGLGRPR